jgi:lipopolysaccharide/colanic/teichoic acid biosynthesis glycosyltransferase
VDEAGACFDWIRKIKANLMLRGLIIVLFSREVSPERMRMAKQLNVHDYYAGSFRIDEISDRLVFLVRFKLIRPKLTELSEQVDITYRMPVVKRLFDILFSGILLLVLSPLLLLIALAIRLESKGPVIYRSKRVGTGYKIFDFYKFRSMYPDADKRLKELQELNQYTEKGAQSVFVKLRNDPRVTRVGRILRNTSLDELPQLLNIFRGDMSTVGNRPLPLYEAEQLTSHEWAWRFMAPAGLTGLWQISRRGKENMSERERKKLDNFYARKYSIWLDLKILFKTLPAMFQHENV